MARKHPAAATEELHDRSLCAHRGCGDRDELIRAAVAVLAKSGAAHDAAKSDAMTTYPNLRWRKNVDSPVMRSTALPSTTLRSQMPGQVHPLRRPSHDVRQFE